MQAMPRPPRGPQVQTLGRRLLPGSRETPYLSPTLAYLSWGRQSSSFPRLQAPLTIAPPSPAQEEVGKSESGTHSRPRDRDFRNPQEEELGERWGARECVENIFMRCEFHMPVFWVHGHVPHTSTRPGIRRGPG